MTLSFHKVDFDAQEVLDMVQDSDDLDEFTDKFIQAAEIRSRQ